MNDDWASDSEEETGLGNLSALPDLPPPPPPSSSPDPPASPATAATPAAPPHAFPGKPTPPPNAWAHPPGIRGPARHSAPPSHPPPRSRGPRGPVSLHVTNLPFDTEDRDLAAFFTRSGLPPLDLRLHRHADGRRVRSATVVFRPDVPNALALSLHGRPFRNRPLNIRLDADRDRVADYGPPSSHTPPINNTSTPAPPSSGGPPVGTTPDPPAPPPTRKKLQLKPRTKPPPVLEFDARTVDGPRAPHSTQPSVMSPAATARGGAGAGVGGGRRMPSRGRRDRVGEPGRTFDRMGSGGGGEPGRFDRARGGGGPRTDMGRGDRMNSAFNPPAANADPGRSTSVQTTALKAVSTSASSSPAVEMTANGTDGGAWTSAKETGAGKGAAAKAAAVQAREADAKDEAKRPALVNTFAALEVNDSEQ